MLCAISLSTILRLSNLKCDLFKALKRRLAVELQVQRKSELLRRSTETSSNELRYIYGNETFRQANSQSQLFKHACILTDYGRLTVK